MNDPLRGAPTREPSATELSRDDRFVDGPPGRAHVALVLASVLMAISLFLPRPVNFAPLGAFGLFAGAYAPGRRAWAYPLIALGIYVIAIGGYHWLVLGSVFLGFAGPAVLGIRWLRGRVSVGRVGGGALASSVWFFLISNLGSWVAFGIPRGESLVQHYVLGIPFFWNTLAGDVFFCGVLFGGSALMRAWSRNEGPAKEISRSPVRGAGSS
ncbi:MAG: DUF6580 family putative transport protein [Gemmatimonadota bacterium]